MAQKDNLGAEFDELLGLLDAGGASEGAQDTSDASEAEIDIPGGADVAEALRTLVPIDFWPSNVNGGAPQCSGYSAVTHRKACQLKMLGLTDSAIAKHMKIAPVTLQNWKTTHPWFRADMERYEQLGIAFAASKLRQHMDSDPATSLEAVKFFLERRSDEFSPPAVKIDAREAPASAGELAGIVQGLYGIENE